MKRVIYNIKKLLSYFEGDAEGGGLVKPGSWRVNYPDGNRSRLLEYSYARVLQRLHGGVLSYLDEEPKDAH